jgi:tol-pal system protein YbgF
LKKSLAINITITTVVAFFILALLPSQALSEVFVSKEERANRNSVKNLLVKTAEMATEISTLKALLAELETAVAESTTDLEEMHINISSYNGTLEEREFEFTRIKENMDLLNEVLSSMEDRVKMVENLTLSEDKKNGLQEAKTLPELEEQLTKLQSSVEALTQTMLEKFIKMEEKLIALEDSAVEKTMEAAKVADPETLYMEGLNQVRVDKDYDNGLKTFKLFLKNYPKNEFADNARYWMGEIYYAKGDFERALLEFDSVIKEYPKGDKVSASMLKQGYSFEQLGADKEAKLLFERIVKKYPKSEEAIFAKAKLKELAPAPAPAKK